MRWGNLLPKATPGEKVDFQEPYLRHVVRPLPSHFRASLQLFPSNHVGPGEASFRSARAQSLVAHGSQDLFLVLYDDIQSRLILLNLFLIFQDEGLVMKNGLLICEDFRF
jgi:hypothetical protein